MRKQVLAGFIVIIGAPAVLLGSHYLGLISNLFTASETIIVAVVTTMVVGGFSLVWSGRKPDEQESRKKEDIWRAIKQWIELPITRFHDQKDSLPLGEKPPELADTVEKCLSRKYPSLWTDLQKLRQEYNAWKDENLSDRVAKYEGDRLVIDLDILHGYNDFMCSKLMRRHSQLVERVRSEILDKHFTQLKC